MEFQVIWLCPRGMGGGSNLPKAPAKIANGNHHLMVFPLRNSYNQYGPMISRWSPFVQRDIP